MTVILGTKELAPAGNSTQNAPKLGEILIRSGKLHSDYLEIVLQAQKEKSLRFGEAAVKLNLVSRQDVQTALSQQYRYFHLSPGINGFSRELVAAYDPFGTQAEAVRQLRTELLLQWFDGKHRTLAINSADRAAGRSFLVANLAVSFSQLGEETLLIDADMRNSRQHLIFGARNQIGLSSLLSGRVDEDEFVINRFTALPKLAVLPAGPTPPNPLELIGQSSFTKLLADMSQRYSVILIDTPAASLNADGRLIASRAGGSLVLVRRDVSRLAEVSDLVESLNAAGTKIVGFQINNR
jgi:receptor protein-tyrosine kinase